MAMRQIALGTAVSGLGIVSTLLSNLWLMRLVAAEATKDEIGLLMTVNSIIGSFGLLQLGLDLVAAQRITVALGRNDSVEASRFYCQYRLFNRWLTAGLLIVNVAAVAIVYQHDPRTAAMVGLSGLYMISSIASTPDAAALYGSQLLYIASAIRTLAALAMTFLGVLFLHLGTGILCLPLSHAICQIGCVIAMSWFRLNRCPWSLGKVIEPWLGFANQLKLAMAIVGTSLLGVIEVGCEPFIFQAACAESLALTALYTLWLRFPTLSVNFGATLTNNAVPAIIKKLAADRGAGLRMYGLMFIAVACTACSVVLGISVWLTPVVKHWLSGAYDVPSGTGVAALFAIGSGFKTVNHSMLGICHPLGRSSAAVLAGGVTSTVKVLAGLLFVALGWGIGGMALGLALGQFASIAWLSFVLTREGALRWFVAPVAMAALLAVAVLGYLVAQWTERFDIVGTGIGIGVTALVLLAALTGVFRFARAKRNRSNLTTDHATAG